MKRNVLFIAPRLNSFIKNDIDLIKEEVNLQISIYNWYNKSLLPINLLKQLLYLLMTINRYDKVLIHFGGYWSLLPAILGRIFRREVFIVLHGTDTASIPEINYGSLRKPLLRFFCKWSYHYATRLLPVSASLISAVNEFSLDSFKLQGVRHHFPGNKTPFTVIHNGLDLPFWYRTDETKQENAFAAVFTIDQFVLKGGDLILKAAKVRPEFTFYLIGITKKQLDRKGINPPANVVVMGLLKRDELKSIYSQCQFHLQLSIFEGFGLALCEAMLCECIPIGSSVNMIPEIIGSTGYIVEKKELEPLLLVMDRAVEEKNSSKSIQARERIKSNFSNDERRNSLIKVLKQ